MPHSLQKPSYCQTLRIIFLVVYICRHRSAVDKMQDHPLFITSFKVVSMRAGCILRSPRSIILMSVITFSSVAHPNSIADFSSISTASVRYQRNGFSVVCKLTGTTTQKHSCWLDARWICYVHSLRRSSGQCFWFFSRDRKGSQSTTNTNHWSACGCGISWG